MEQKVRERKERRLNKLQKLHEDYYSKRHHINSGMLKDIWKLQDELLADEEKEQRVI